MATPVADCHLTGYFAPYGQGLAGVFGDYETPSKGVMEAGGISYLSHVGEYVYTDKDSQNYVGQLIDDYYPTKFARIFLDCQGSSLGMGINSATDAHTRCDRILYDQILQKTIPNGVVPWSNTFADSHNENAVNDAYTMCWMPEFTVEAFRECQEKGQFFSVSHYSNGVELNGMEEMPGFVEQDVYDTKSYWLDNTPGVTKITVDQESDTITVEGTDANIITWVSNGNVIKREELVDGKATLDLHNDELLDNPNVKARYTWPDVVNSLPALAKKIAANHPKAIVLQSSYNLVENMPKGHNLSADFDADIIVEKMQEAINAVREISPETEILIQSLIPVNSSYEKYAQFAGTAKKVKAANKKLQKKQNKVIFSL